MRGAYIDRRQGSVFPEITSDTASIQSSTLQQITSAIGTALYPSSTGFDTPRSSATNSLVSSTESSDGTTSTPQPSDGNVPTAAPQDNGSGSSGLGGGAIAGIAIAAVLVIALIGGWFFWRRRKRMRGKPTTTEVSAHIAGDGGGGDGGIPELDTKERPQEMPGSRQIQTQELDPTQYTKYAMNGSHELKTESEPVELLNGPDEYTAPVPYNTPQRPAAEMTEMTHTTEATNNSLSSNVEAQRRREMEWLEMEEERMRKRRELLAAQSGAKN